MKKPIHGKWIGKAKNAFFILFILFLLTLPAMDQDLLTPSTKDQEENEVIHEENELPIEERVNYSPLPRLSSIGKAKAVQSGSGSSFEVQETFNGYNSSALGNTTNTFNNPSNRTSSLNIINPTIPNYSKQNGTITVANITAENEWQEIEPDATSPIITLGGATSNPNTTAMEFNITDTTVNVINVTLNYATSNWALKTVTLEIRNESAGTVSDNIIESVNMDNVGSTPIWYGYPFTTSLIPGSYFVVVNASELSGTSYSLTWWGESDSGNDDNGNVFVWNGTTWELNTWDLAVNIQVLPVDGGNPKTYVADEVAMNVTYDGNSEPFDSSNSTTFGSTSAELFTFETNVSVSFNVTFNILFERTQNYSALTAYYVNSFLPTADWNITFSSVAFSPVNYLVYNRTYTINTFPTQWWSLTVYNGTNVYPSNMWDRTGTVLNINATQKYSDASNWRINAISANYVTNVTVIDAPGELGQSLSVNTTFNATYTPTSAMLNLTYDCLSNGNWTGPTHNDLDTNPNPYTSNDVLNTTWPHGQYNVSAFYYSGVEVGLNVSTTINVYRPTALDITRLPGSVLKGNAFTMQVRLRDTTKNTGIGGANVTFNPEWSGSIYVKTNATGYAETSISSAGASLGPKNIDIQVAENATEFHWLTSNSGSITIRQSASISGFTYKSSIGYNDSTKIQVSYAADANVKIKIDGIQKSMGEIDSGRYSYKFDGTEWGLGSHEFTINAAKAYHEGDSVSGSINVGNNPTELRTTGLYVSSVTFPDLQNNSTLQLAYTDTFELSLAYVDLVHNTTTGNASLTFDWMEGELQTLQNGAGGNYTLSIEGTTIGRHTLAINMSQYGHRPQEFEMSFDVVNNPTALSVDPTIPTNRTLSIEYSEEAMVGLYIEDTNHTLPLSITPTINGWTNYSVVESPTGNYSFTFNGDWVTPEEGQPVDIVFQPYGYEPQTFSYTLIVQHRTIMMTVEVEGLEEITDEFNMTAGESIFVNVQLNYTNGDPVPNVDVIAIFTVGSKSSQGSSSSLALNVVNLQDAQLQSFNISGTTDKQGWVILAFKTTADMGNIQKIEVVFKGDATNGAVGMEFNAVNIRIFRPVAPSLWDMLLEYWYLTAVAAVLIMILIWYLIRLTRRRMVYRVELEKKIQRTYDFIMDIVNLDAIIGILRDGTAFYDLMIGEELDPQLYSSFLTALRTYASTTIAARRPVAAEEDLVAEAVDTEEKAHALMGDKESYIASGELISFAFVFTARFDETGQWLSISTITRETAREAVEEIEIQFESEILRFQEVRDLSAIPQDHIYLAFTDILGLDFLKPHRTTRRGKNLTKEEQTALKVARNIEALEGQILLPLVAKRLIDEGKAKERAIYALQQLRVKGGVETVEQNQVEDTTILEEEEEHEENAGEE